MRLYESRVKNILSFEVEDAFHMDNLNYESGEVKSRIIPILIHLLNILDNYNARATFFILGWVASRFPEIVTLLDSRGHEVASHGYSHRDLTKLEPEKLESEIRLSRETLESVLNSRVLGFKGACDPIDKNRMDIIREISKAGFVYDCSVKMGVYPGKPNEPIDVNFKEGGSIKIFPQTAVKKYGVWLRFGEKLRLYPSWFTIRAVARLNRMGYPAMLNLKLWELDKHQHRGAGADFLRYRRYGNLNLAEEKLLRVLDIFEFTTCAESLGLED